MTHAQRRALIDAPISINTYGGSTWRGSLIAYALPVNGRRSPRAFSSDDAFELSELRDGGTRTIEDNRIYREDA